MPASSRFSRLRRVGPEDNPGSGESTLPWWLLGTGAALGGAGAALHAGLSSSDAQKIQGFVNLRDKSYEANQAGDLQRIKDYVAQGHQATSAKLFGSSAEDILRGARSTPTADALDVSWEEGSGKHYQEFAASPLRAYQQRVSEVGLGPYVASLNDRLKEFKADPQEVPIGGAFDEWLKTKDSGLSSAKDRVDMNLGTTLRKEDPVSIYSNWVADPLLKARKYLPWIGGGLALGGAGWLLHRYLAEQDEAAAKAGKTGVRDLKKAAKFVEGVLGVLGASFEKQAQLVFTNEAFCLGFVETLDNAGLL